MVANLYKREYISSAYSLRMDNNNTKHIWNRRANDHHIIVARRRPPAHTLETKCQCSVGISLTSKNWVVCCRIAAATVATMIVIVNSIVVRGWAAWFVRECSARKNGLGMRVFFKICKLSLQLYVKIQYNNFLIYQYSVNRTIYSKSKD